MSQQPLVPPQTLGQTSSGGYLGGQAKQGVSPWVPFPVTAAGFSCVLFSPAVSGIGTLEASRVVYRMQWAQAWEALPHFARGPPALRMSSPASWSPAGWPLQAFPHLQGGSNCTATRGLVGLEVSAHSVFVGTAGRTEATGRPAVQGQCAHWQGGRLAVNDRGPAWGG